MDPAGSCLYDLCEIAKHNSPDDCWLVIDGKVYNVTPWVPSHPGGSLIRLKAGQDSTYLFNSYHPLYVRKLLPQYCIGQVKRALDGSDAELVSANVQYTGSLDEEFYTTVKQRVESFFLKNKIDARYHPQMFLKSLLIFAGLLTCYLSTFYRQQHFASAFASALGMGFFIAQVGLSIMHDANHGAYSRSSVLGYVMGASIDFVGASSFMWKYQHVVGHHSFTNVQSYDPDIRVKDPDIRRVTKDQPRHEYHAYQHVYLGLLYGLLALKSIFFDDFSAYFTGSIGPVKIPRMTPTESRIFWWGKAVYGIYMLLMPVVFSHHSLATFLILYISSQLVTGWMLAFLFQVAHVVEEADFLNAEYNQDVKPSLSSGWAASQVKTTANFSVKSFFWTHLSGGLNFQIEHHLFPAVCHLHYPKIQPIVQATCKEFGIRYHHFPDIWTALRAHFAYLKKIGNNIELRLAG